MTTTARTARAAPVAIVLAATLAGVAPARGADAPDRPRAEVVANATLPAATPAADPLPADLRRTGQTIALFAAASLLPAAVLMLTAFIRIHVVLTLLRQALGSPQVPGNQVLMALALLLTALVMRPEAEAVYRLGIEPFAAGRATPAEAWEAGTRPLKAFMGEQIARTGRDEYLWALYEHAQPDGPEPAYYEEFPFTVLAPAFVLGELTTALLIGFYVYLTFLVVDLVVAAVLAAMGLVMLPPAQVATPLKLILFVLADGWLRVAEMLLRSFEAVPGSGG